MNDPNDIKKNEDLLKVLKQFPTLELVSEKDLLSLLKNGKVTLYKPGDLIIDETSSLNQVHYLLSGKVRVVKHGRELIVLRRVGDYIGKKGMIDGLVQSASVYAITVCKLLTFDITQIDWSLESDNLALQYLLFRVLAEIFAYQLKITNTALEKANLEIEQLKNQS